MTIYDFEKAEIKGDDVQKERGRGCDLAVLLKMGNNCDLILVECKKGKLSISDFEDAIKQLKYSIEVVYRIFDDRPDEAVICYERCYPQVVNHFRVLMTKPLYHNVPLILKRFGEDRTCSDCLG